MTELLLIYPPFCTPASPPYSITNIYANIKENSKIKVKALDLNIHYHEEHFKKYRKKFQTPKKNNYEETSKKCVNEFKNNYAKNHEKILKQKKPQSFKKLLNLILKENPNKVAFSIVYSSQVFYAYALIKELNKKGIETIVGGPSVSETLKKEAKRFFKDEHALLNYLKIKKNKKTYLNYNIYNLKKYFSPQPVLPLKTSSTCAYKQCTFCTHYQKQKYEEYDLETINETIKKNKAKHYFLIDDMIPPKRLLELAKIFKKNKIKWTAQLKPTKSYTKKTLQELKKSGLTYIMWGVESGNNRILKMMKKSTNKETTAQVLKNAKEAKIINVVYIMFGFPTETKQEFKETINFLENEKENIDLISTSIFGLQKGTHIYNNPKKYEIKKITQEKRTLLEPKISYETQTGITNKEATKLKKKHQNLIEKINKYPKKTNFFREHLFFLN